MSLSSDSIRVVIADDHAVVRQGIRGVLEEIEGLEVVAEAGDGNEALAMTEAERPDLVVLDVTMPGKTGIEVLVLVARGMTNRGIADQLGISPRTVETHRERVMGKLRIRSVAGLTRFVVEHGLDSAEPPE